MGDSKRIALVVADMVSHFVKRWEAMDGKVVAAGLSDCCIFVQLRHGAVFSI